MQSINSLIRRLVKDYPEYSFAKGAEFWWSATQKTIFYDPHATHSREYILHELSHALLNHTGYLHDIELVKLERDAWNYADSTLSVKYGITIDEDVVQDNLDTYRDWLHSRSTCPECETTGIEVRTHRYKCIACKHTWHVNEARLCALRRYLLQTK